MKATFENTVDILVKAYLNGTLEHGNCTMCAVGNIVASSCPRLYKLDRGAWYDLVMSYEGEITKEMIQQLDKLTIKQINKTGYTYQQIILIEKAFEDAEGYDDKGNYLPDDVYNFNGLMAVVDVLADIHGIDLKQKQEAKAMFVKV